MDTKGLGAANVAGIVRAMLAGMTIDQIKSERVRAIIAGSATPGTDLRDIAGELSVADFREACAYFGGYSKLVDQAISERNFCVEHDC